MRLMEKVNCSLEEEVIHIDSYLMMLVCHLEKSKILLELASSIQICLVYSALIQLKFQALKNDLAVCLQKKLKS